MPSQTESTGSRRSSRWREGQSTVEYALVVVAFLAVAIALGVLWRFVSEGNLAQEMTETLTHRIPQSVLDVMLF